MVPQGRDYFVIIHPLFVVFTTAILFSAQLLLDCKIDYLTLLLCPILIMVNLGLQFSSPFLETVKRHSPFTKPALVAYSNLKLSKNNYMATHKCLFLVARLLLTVSRFMALIWYTTKAGYSEITWRFLFSVQLSVLGKHSLKNWNLKKRFLFPGMITTN